jgi:penicillin-binding protein 1A
MGVEKSRNLMTVRLANEVGMDKIAEYAARFGIIQNLPQVLSMSLGAGETTLLNLTSAYAMLVNGGKRIAPSLIDRVQDRAGMTVHRFDARPCPGCTSAVWTNQPAPEIPDEREQITDPLSAYQMVSILQGVVQRGTGLRIGQTVNKPLAGKTGTSNDSLDTWFVGFAPDLAVGVFVGFDEPRTLGAHETGATAASPIFANFMREALGSKPAAPFRIPPGIKLVRVNHTTGLLPRPGDTDVILEAFKPDTIPTGVSKVLGAGDFMIDSSGGDLPAAGGLY